ncbi:MAG: hypothetical protein ABJM43_20335 [Paracoccaceae bacterium]
MLLTSIGALICFYLALDLYLVFAGYHATPASDYVFVAALTGIGMLFVAATLKFWYFPWSWSTIVVDVSGVEISVTGWGAMPKTNIPWTEFSEVSVIILPRGASRLDLQTKDGLKRVIRTWSIEGNIDDVLFVLGHFAETQGLKFVGPPLSAPVLGRRSWSLSRSEK